MAKAVIAVYEDLSTAKRVVFDLYNKGGVQRDYVRIISGTLVTHDLDEFEQSWVRKREAYYQDLLKEGKALLIAWVMGPWRKDAAKVFRAYDAVDYEEVNGRRWAGFNTTRT
jgi:hypothetical protein